MRLLITASRDWVDRTLIWGCLDVIYCWWLRLSPEPGEKFIVVHGAARGGDTRASEWVADRQRYDPRIDEDPHPVSLAEWRIQGPSAGHRRNGVMVKKGARLCVGFPLGKSNGTRGCLKLAVAAKIETYRIEDWRVYREV